MMPDLLASSPQHVSQRCPSQSVGGSDTDRLPAGLRRELVVKLQYRRAVQKSSQVYS
jgi:hypothetical protein